MIFTEEQKLEDIRAEMDKLNVIYAPTGEEVEFTVTEYGTRDKETAKRKFKVDSNLPAWEGEDSGVEKFKELDEILAETFKGRLLLHHVDIGGEGSVDSNVGTAPEQSSVSPIGEAELKKHFGQAAKAFWNGVPNVSAASLVTSMVVYQDDQEDAAAEEASADQVDDDAADSEPADGAETPDAATPVTQPAPLGGQIAAPAARNANISVTRQLTVSPDVMGKTLVAFIEEAASRANVLLEKDQIEVDSPDIQEDEGASSTISSDWKVTMQVRSEADADKVLAEWQQQFNATPYFPTSSSVGSQIAGQTVQQAWLAVIASLLGIIAYVWVRFQNLAFGLAAVVALIHDVLIVLGAIAFSHWLAGVLGFLRIDEFKISLEIIAALLTVIGYSLNDTIVVFDRIREVRGKRTEITADMINTSISQTLSRTILTSLTTFLVVAILYWFGGDAIHGFAFALVIGVIVGTYSSIFVASPALLWLMNSVGLNPGEVDPEVAKAN